MQLQEAIDDLAFSPSFSYYFSDSLTAAAAAKVSREFKQEQAAQLHELSEFDEAEFAFSMEMNGDGVSGKQFTLKDQQLVFPVFDGEILTKDEVEQAVEEIEDASSVTSHLQKLIVGDREDFSSSSSSSSESDDLQVRPSGMFCMWRSKADVASSPLTKGRKSSSTGSGSGSRTWRIRNLLRRSNSEGKESVFFLSSNRVKASKQKRNTSSGDATKVTGNLKTTTSASSPSFQELFYVQKRAEQKGHKMKSYMPYRQDLLGFFVNINRSGNKKLSI